MLGLAGAAGNRPGDFCLELPCLYCCAASGSSDLCGKCCSFEAERALAPLLQSAL
jgi:hypothetical protein